jgi:hypothetical protein
MMFIPAVENQHLTAMWNQSPAFRATIQNAGAAGRFDDADVRFLMFYGSITRPVAVAALEAEIADVDSGFYL